MNFGALICSYKGQIQPTGMSINYTLLPQIASVFLCLLLVVPNFAEAQRSSKAGTSKAKLKSKKSKKKSKSWSVNGSTGAGRGLDYYSEVGMSHSLGVGTKVFKESRIGTSVSYSHPVERNKVRDPDRYGFEDVGLSFSSPLGKSPYLPHTQWTFTTSASLPTSKTSQKASKIVGGGVGISTSSTGFLSGRITTGHTLLGTAYQYDTADKAGFQYNSPVAFSNSVGFSIRFLRIIGLSVGGSLYTYYNYAGNIKNVQGVSTGLNFMLSRNINMSVGYRWRDRLVSNNSLFDDDTTSVSASLQWSI